MLQKQDYCVFYAVSYYGTTAILAEKTNKGERK
jgi:hypothetical protein